MDGDTDTEADNTAEEGGGGLGGEETKKTSRGWELWTTTPSGHSPKGRQTQNRPGSTST